MIESNRDSIDLYFYEFNIWTIWKGSRRSSENYNFTMNNPMFVKFFFLYYSFCEDFGISMWIYDCFLAVVILIKLKKRILFLIIRKIDNVSVKKTQKKPQRWKNE